MNVCQLKFKTTKFVPLSAQRYSVHYHNGYKNCHGKERCSYCENNSKLINRFRVLIWNSDSQKLECLDIPFTVYNEIAKRKKSDNLIAIEVNKDFSRHDHINDRRWPTYKVSGFDSKESFIINEFWKNLKKDRNLTDDNWFQELVTKKKDISNFCWTTYDKVDQRWYQINSEKFHSLSYEEILKMIPELSLHGFESLNMEEILKSMKVKKTAKDIGDAIRASLSSSFINNKDIDEKQLNNLSIRLKSDTDHGHYWEIYNSKVMGPESTVIRYWFNKSFKEKEAYTLATQESFDISYMEFLDEFVKPEFGERLLSFWEDGEVSCQDFMDLHYPNLINYSFSNSVGKFSFVSSPVRDLWTVDYINSGNKLYLTVDKDIFPINSSFKEEFKIEFKKSDFIQNYLQFVVLEKNSIHDFIKRYYPMCVKQVPVLVNEGSTAAYWRIPTEKLDEEINVYFCANEKYGFSFVWDPTFEIEFKKPEFGEKLVSYFQDHKKMDCIDFMALHYPTLGNHIQSKYDANNRSWLILDKNNKPKYKYFLENSNLRVFGDCTELSFNKDNDIDFLLEFQKPEFGSNLLRFVTDNMSGDTEEFLKTYYPQFAKYISDIKFTKSLVNSYYKITFYKDQKVGQLSFDLLSVRVQDRDLFQKIYHSPEFGEKLIQYVRNKFNKQELVFSTEEFLELNYPQIKLNDDDLDYHYMCHGDYWEPETQYWELYGCRFYYTAFQELIEQNFYSSFQLVLFGENLKKYIDSENTLLYEYTKKYWEVCSDEMLDEHSVFDRIKFLKSFQRNSSIYQDFLKIYYPNMKLKEPVTNEKNQKSLMKDAKDFIKMNEKVLKTYLQEDTDSLIKTLNNNAISESKVKKTIGLASDKEKLKSFKENILSAKEMIDYYLNNQELKISQTESCIFKTLGGHTYWEVPKINLWIPYVSEFDNLSIPFEDPRFGEMILTFLHEKFGSLKEMVDYFIQFSFPFGELSNYISQQTNNSNKSENPMKIKKSIFELLKKEAVDAAYRAAAKHTSTAVTEKLQEAAEKNSSPFMKKFINSKLGESLVSTALGHAVPMLTEDEKAKRLAAELRSNGLFIAFNQVANSAIETLRPQAQAIWDKLPIPQNEKSKIRIETNALDSGEEDDASDLKAQVKFLKPEQLK